MNLKVEQPVSIICVYTWVGFICGISFLEAWLKFRAPGVTLPVGLSIGRIVFAALNKVEWVFAVSVFSSLIFYKKFKWSLTGCLFAIIIAILTIQTSWLLPQLDFRAQLYINGSSVPKSNLHIYFIVAEFVKVIALISFGIRLFKK